MGYSYSQDDGPVMCFKAPKNVKVGWYNDRVVTLTSSTNYAWSGRVYGIANYATTTSADEMILRLDDPSDNTKDIYVSFNAKNGYNSGTAEAGNRVLIHTKAGETGAYAQSWLQAKLSGGGVYNAAMSDQTVEIRVLSIDTAASPPYAVVQVGAGSTPTDPPTKAPTKAPTASPTNGPTRVASNAPSVKASSVPTMSPTIAPVPTRSPTTSPTAAPIQCSDLNKFDCSAAPDCEWWGKNKVCRSVDAPAPSPVSSPSPPSPIDCSSYTNNKACGNAGCKWSGKFKTCS